MSGLANVLELTRRPNKYVSENVGMDYVGNDVEGMVAGGNRNFCAKPESAYRSIAFGDMWQFDITYAGGGEQMAYCMEKGVRGPQGSPYPSMPLADCLPNLTEAKTRQINWVLANAFPAIGHEAMFEKAGVDASLAPALNADDAYAAVQVTLWSLINPPKDRESGWRFIKCVGGGIHPKSARLKQTST